MKDKKFIVVYSDRHSESLADIINHCYIYSIEDKRVEIRKGTKRLKRKLGPIQQHFRNINYGKE